MLKRTFSARTLWESMKRCSLLAIGLLFSALARSDELTLRADPWCPYNCEPGPEPGYMIEVAERIFTRAGHRIDYQTTNWGRAKLQLSSAEISAVVGMALQETNAYKWFFPSVELGVEQHCFYTRKGSGWRYQNLQSLATVRLGVINSYGYGPVLDKYISDNRGSERIMAISETNGLLRNLQLVKLGRIDVTLENRVVMEHALKEHQLSTEIQQSGCRDDSRPLYIVFSRADPKAAEYAALLSAGISSMRASGELREILGRYGVADWR